MVHKKTAATLTTVPERTLAAAQDGPGSPFSQRIPSPACIPEVSVVAAMNSSFVNPICKREK